LVDFFLGKTRNGFSPLSPLFRKNILVKPLSFSTKLPGSFQGGRSLLPRPLVELLILPPFFSSPQTRAAPGRTLFPSTNLFLHGPGGDLPLCFFFFLGSSSRPFFFFFPPSTHEPLLIFFDRCKFIFKLSGCWSNTPEEFPASPFHQEHQPDQGSHST